MTIPSPAVLLRGAAVSLRSGTATLAVDVRAAFVEAARESDATLAAVFEAVAERMEGSVTR
jgi:hypothetical protein